MFAVNFNFLGEVVLVNAHNSISYYSGEKQIPKFGEFLQYVAKIDEYQISLTNEGIRIPHYQVPRFLQALEKFFGALYFLRKAKTFSVISFFFFS